MSLENGREIRYWIGQDLLNGERTFGIHKMLKVPCTAQEILPSVERFCSIESVIYLRIYLLLSLLFCGDK
jgi:hypothetical protein